MPSTEMLILIVRLGEVSFLGDTLATVDLLGFKNESDYRGVNYAYSTFNTNTSTHHAVYQLPNGKAHS